MKKYICECVGCRKTATVRLRNDHRICDDHDKGFRRLKRAGKKLKAFYKEVLIGHLSLGPGDKGFDICRDVVVKL